MPVTRRADSLRRWSAPGRRVAGPTRPGDARPQSTPQRLWLFAGGGWVGGGEEGVVVGVGGGLNGPNRAAWLRDIAEA